MSLCAVPGESRTSACSAVRNVLAARDDLALPPLERVRSPESWCLMTRARWVRRWSRNVSSCSWSRAWHNIELNVICCLRVSVRPGPRSASNSFKAIRRRSDACGGPAKDASGRKPMSRGPGGPVGVVGGRHGRGSRIPPSNGRTARSASSAGPTYRRRCGSPGLVKVLLWPCVTIIAMRSLDMGTRPPITHQFVLRLFRGLFKTPAPQACDLRRCGPINGTSE